MKTPKKCEDCGTEFIAKRNHERARWCSPECSRKNKNKKRQDEAKKEKAKRTCIVCGTSLAHKRLQSKCCSANCRNKLSRKNQITEGRKCKQCGVNIDHLSITARYCSDSCRTSWNNQNARSRNKLPTKTIPCKCCGKEFETSSAEYCSQKCRNIKVGEWRECPECKNKYLTTKGGKRVCCSQECTRLNRLKKRNYRKYCIEVGIEVPEKPEKAKTKRIGTKTRVKKKTVPMAQQIANVKEALESYEPVEVPMFKSEPEPKQVAGNKLKNKIANFGKKRGFTEPDRMKAMQDEWLKKNKATVVEYVPYKYEAYKGTIEPTNVLTQEGVRNNKDVRVLREGGIKDYGM